MGCIDAEIGNRIRLMRTLVGMSQEKLGQLLGSTFQPIQKYEKGANRISTGRLLDVAHIFGAPINAFYEGLSEPSSESPALVTLMQNFSGQDLQFSLAITRIKDVKLRRH